MRPIMPIDLNEKIYTKESEQLASFQASIIHGRIHLALMEYQMNVTTMALKADKDTLPQGFMVQSIYMTLRNGSSSIEVILENNTSQPITIEKGIAFARVIAVNEISKPLIALGTVDKLEKVGRVSKTQMPKDKQH